MCERIGRPWWQARMLAEVARLALAEGDLELAYARSIRLIELAVEIGDRARTLLGLSYLACGAARRGDLERAGHIFGFLESQNDRRGIVAAPGEVAAHLVTSSALADPLLQQGRRDGRGLSLRQILDRSLAPGMARTAAGDPAAPR